MNILENELVRKYFGENDSRSQDRRTNWAMSHRILRAMQEPIKKGEGILQIMSDDRVIEKTEAYGDHFNLHLDLLRLPDRFQKQECQFCETYKIHICDPKPTPEPDLSWKCHCGVLYPSELHKQNCKPKDEVEEKLKVIEKVCSMNGLNLGINLRELVALARRSV